MLLFKTERTAIVASGRDVAQLGKRLQSVHHWHGQVELDQVWLYLGGDLDCRGTVVGLAYDGETEFEFELDADELAEIGDQLSRRTLAFSS